MNDIKIDVYVSVAVRQTFSFIKLLQLYLYLPAVTNVNITAAKNVCHTYSVSPKVSNQRGRSTENLKRHIYHFRYYWPSNLVFIVACVMYIPNLRSTEITIAIMDKRHCGQTYTQVIIQCISV